MNQCKCGDEECWFTGRPANPSDHFSLNDRLDLSDIGHFVSRYACGKGNQLSDYINPI